MPQQVTYLSGTTGNIPTGTKGFDSDAKLNSYPEMIASLSSNYSFAIRYITLGSEQNTSVDLDYYEGTDILNSGMGLMVVQHVRDPGWEPSGTLGTSDGKNTRANAYYVGLPAHVNVWLDLEGVSSSVSASDVIDYCNNWYDEISAWGYVPGLYVGANCGLSSYQLYYDLNVAHYWDSNSSSAPTPDVRGFQMYQQPETTYTVNSNTIFIDADNVSADNEGGLPQWLYQ